MTGFANLVVDLLGQGDLDATIAAFGDMSIDIVVTGTGLTTANVGAAVWSALAAANNDAGTMGEKLNDAGSASNPWTEVLETGFTAGELLLITAAAVAGKLDRVDNGDGTFTITIRGLADTKDRIVGIVDENGNRVSATYDGT
jgi:phage tail sheath gpL-like